MKTILMAWKGFWAAYRLLRDTDKIIGQRFSREWWLILRWRMELWLYYLSLGNDKGWRKVINADRHLIEGAQVFLNSSLLRDITCARSKAELDAAVLALENKIRDRYEQPRMDPVLRPGADRMKP
jgi:hypothetical protein